MLSVAIFIVESFYRPMSLSIFQPLMVLDRRLHDSRTLHGSMGVTKIYIVHASLLFPDSTEGLQADGGSCFSTVLLI